MLAVQLMKPTAAAAADLVRNAEGNAQNAGKYDTVPNPISVNARMSSVFERGKINHRLKPSAAVSWGTAKCQRRSRVRSEFHPTTSMPINPAMNGIAPISATHSVLHPVSRFRIVGSQNQKI